MRSAILALLLIGRVAAADGDPVRYEVIATDAWLSSPVTLVYADDRPNDVAWVSSRAFGGTIIEHGGGIISKLNTAFLSGAGGYVGTDAARSVDYYDTRMLPAGPEASWSLDLSDAFVRFRADAWFNRYVGWRFGLWSLRQLDSDPASTHTDPTQELLQHYGALYLNETGGVEIEVRLRYARTLAQVARATVSFDLPVPYLVGEPLVALGGLDPGDRGMLYAWGGVPRVQLDLDRTLGPIVLRVSGSVPTGWLVVPLHEGAQLTLAAGVAF